VVVDQVAARVDEALAGQFQRGLARGARLRALLRFHQKQVAGAPRTFEQCADVLSDVFQHSLFGIANSDHCAQQRRNGIAAEIGLSCDLERVQGEAEQCLPGNIRHHGTAATLRLGPRRNRDEYYAAAVSLLTFC